MTRFPHLGPLVLFAIVCTLGCGGSRQLQTVTPDAADAKSFTNGQAPFTATGTFTKPPSPTKLTSSNVAWCIGTSSGVCDPDIPTSPSVNQVGVAQCGSFVGTATVLAGIPEPGIADAPRFKTFGSAQLTCP